MDIKLKGLDAMPVDIEMEYFLIYSVKNTYGKHCHDFYEIFLVIEGSLIHCINDRRIQLIAGDLVFIRPSDVHYYEKLGDADGKFINLSFLEKPIMDMFSYLGDGVPMDWLLSAEMPPSVHLLKADMEYIHTRLDRLNTIPSQNKTHIKAELRSSLADIFCRYFINSDIKHEKYIPEWLQELCFIMKRKENFSNGLNILIKLSGRNHSYLCRIFNQYFSVTPTKFINDLRLNYVENLLLNTDMEILLISMEAGFENLGHFYKLFKLRNNISPNAFRKKFQQITFINSTKKY